MGSPDREPGSVTLDEVRAALAGTVFSRASALRGSVGVLQGRPCFFPGVPPRSLVLFSEDQTSFGPLICYVFSTVEGLQRYLAGNLEDGQAGPMPFEFVGDSVWTDRLQRLGGNVQDWKEGALPAEDFFDVRELFPREQES